MNKKICGIDEAGRGPLAGPLCVAGVIFKKDIANNKQFTFLNDSKKLTEKKRELLFPLIKENSHYYIVLKSNHEIDKFGISYCLKTAIMEIMNNMPKDEGINFLIDGNTSFGIENLNHLIKADTLIKEVSAASILAKVTRDRFMMEISKDYPLYEFTKHKGYGTALHVEKIKLFGKSNLHRLTFKLKGIDS